MTTLYLVRHAHADWTPDEHRPLSARGAADAQRVADLLARRPITAIYSSPACRAQQTVLPLAQRLKLPMTDVCDLRERELSAQPVDDFETAVRATWDDPAHALPGGESNVTAQRRGVEVVARLQRDHPGEQIVLATHGNLLALIAQHFDPAIGYTFWQSLTMPDVYQLTLPTTGAAALRRLWSA